MFFLLPLLSFIVMLASLGLQVKPSVLIGANYVKKEILLRDARLGEITDIIARKDAGKSFQLVVAGAGGAIRLKGGEREFIRFSQGTSLARIVDLESDGSYEFLTKANGLESRDQSFTLAGTTVKLLDTEGNELWWRQIAPVGMPFDVGDINGDGLIEVFVPSGEDTLLVLSRAGDTVRQIKVPNLWKFRLIDINGDGKAELVRIRSASVEVTELDRKSSKVFELEQALFESTLMVSPTGKEPARIVGYDKGAVYVLSLEGKILMRTEVEKLPIPPDVYAVPVRFRGGQGEYLAVSLTVYLPPASRSCLCLIDANGKLLYEEILAEPVQALCPVAEDAEAGEEALLIGGKGRLYKYGLKVKDEVAPSAHARAER